MRREEKIVREDEKRRKGKIVREDEGRGGGTRCEGSDY